MNNVQILKDDLMRISGNNIALLMHKKLSVNQRKSVYSGRFFTAAGGVTSCGSTAAMLPRFLRTSLKLWLACVIF